MSTLTPNYDFILPGVNDPVDQDLWGGELNANFSSLDTILKTQADAIAAISPEEIGVGKDYWGDTAPAKYVFSYGQDLSRTTYSLLFAVFGTKYGSGDGSTTFGMPDKRGRASFGKDDMGGVSANRLTGLTGGINGDVLGGAGGEEAHTLTVPEMPSHSHTLPVSATFNGNVSAGSDVQQVGSGATTGSTGGGGAHNTVPPGIVCNYIIYTGV